MSSPFEHILDAARSLALSRDVFRRVDKRRAHKILQDIKRHFLTRVDSSRWWEHLRYEAASATLEGTRDWIAGLSPSGGKKVWLVACDEDFVYEAEPETIRRVLAMCPRFPVAVADKKLGWMIVVSHPDRVFAIGDVAIDRLKTVAGTVELHPG